MPLQPDKRIRVKDKISADKHIKIEPFRKEVRITKPHKHNQYFEIVYLSNGGGAHWIDGVRYAVKPPVLFFINRNQIHNWELENEPDGYVIILKNSFFQHSKDESLKQLLHLVWHANCLYLGQAEEIPVLLQLLAAHTMQNVYELHSIDGLLKALIAAILRKGAQHFLHSGLQTRLYTHYIDLLLTRKDVLRKVSDFARELHTTPQNLNAACRKAVNQSASEILDEFIIHEACRLLLYTDNHVSEIAYQLSFKDPSYFVKFFKKYRHATPEEFRKRNFQNYHQ
jgi:AraC family transcriptional activator of pobA